jgi:hypothetical protein
VDAFSQNIFIFWKAQYREFIASYRGHQIFIKLLFDFQSTAQCMDVVIDEVWSLETHTHTSKKQ